MAISSVLPLAVSTPTESIKTGKTSAANTVNNIGQTFSQMLDNLQTTEATSDNLLQQLSAGEDVDVAKLMIATEQTDISMRVAMGVRDRLVETYREVMRMTV